MPVLVSLLVVTAATLVALAAFLGVYYLRPATSAPPAERRRRCQPMARRHPRRGGRCRTGSTTAPFRRIAPRGQHSSGRHTHGEA